VNNCIKSSNITRMSTLFFMRCVTPQWQLRHSDVDNFYGKKVCLTELLASGSLDTMS